MTLIRTLALTAALALTALGAPATSTISIVGSVGPGAFNPNPITIASGDSVVWANNDGTIHHIVLDDGSYDSGNLTPGSSSPATAALTATGAYHCIIHPSMTGTITVTAGCTLSIAPTSTSIPAAAATGTVTVTAGAGCGWTAVSNSGFITVTSGAAGTGNGTVAYSVTANPSASPRTGTITIAGQTFTVTQAGAGCAPIALAPASLPTATVGVPYSVTIVPSGGTAPYTFAVAVGALPPGITLSAGGVIAGTGTGAASAGFTLGVTDAVSCVGSQAYTLTVIAPVPALPAIWLALLVAATIALAARSLSRSPMQGRSG